MAPACWKEAALSALHSSLGFSSPSSLSAQGVDTSFSEAMANCHSGVRPVRHLSSESSVESTERVREQEGPGLTIGLSRPRKLAKYV